MRSQNFVTAGDPYKFCHFTTRPSRVPREEDPATGSRIAPRLGTDLPETQLAPFYGFSPVIKTLRMSISVALSPQVFDLIRSFPLLEALSLNHSSFDRWIGGGDDFIRQPPSAILPSNPPAFTGSLELSLETGIDPAASWLLSLPSGPHFRELCLTWKCKEDVALTTALIEKCSSTLESLVIGPRPGSGTLILHLPLH